MMNWLRYLWKNNTFKVISISFLLGLALVVALRVIYGDEEI